MTARVRRRVSLRWILCWPKNAEAEVDLGGRSSFVLMLHYHSIIEAESSSEVFFACAKGRKHLMVWWRNHLLNGRSSPVQNSGSI
jgi:hypothetical protein